MSLIAHYKLNGDANDASGNGHDGAPTDVSYDTGKAGQAASFNGSSSKIQVPDAADLRMTDTGTLACWFKRGDTSAVNMKLIIKGNSSAYTALSYQLYLNSGYPRLYLSNGSTGVIIQWPSQVSDTGWHHLVGAWDGSCLNLYLDGEAATPVAQTVNVQADTSDLWLGINGTIGNQQFYGLIDDARIYSEALAANEIKAIYNSGKGTEAALFGPYRVEEAQTACTGAEAGEDYNSGAIIGQDFHAGAVAGETN
ncbi:MAG: LamG domain-containing protein [Pirellulales bacterium]|nr:LamG domain-containing protein [Pirellulales bacterium]